MTNREHQEAKLVTDLFHTQWNEGSVAACARRAAAHARHRHTIRKSFIVAACVVLGGGMTFFSVFHWLAARSEIPLPRFTENTRGYDIISDDELVAQLNDRPLLLVRRDSNSREIVILDNEAMLRVDTP